MQVENRETLGISGINAPDVVSDFDPLTENYTIEPDNARRPTRHPTCSG